MITTEQARYELLRHLDDREWRMDNLYWIKDKDGNEVVFERNNSQLEFWQNMWWLNVILKDRQRGFSTLIAIFILDTCIFNANTAAGIIDITLPDAKKKLDKIRFAYERLPEIIKQRKPLVEDKKESIEWANGSRVDVSTSHRGGTLQILHLSEYGKISARKPDVAREIKSGAFNTVSPGNFLMVESTAEGQEGEFFEICQESQRVQAQGQQLTTLDFKFHFFGWWQGHENELPEGSVAITEEIHQYCDKLEVELGIKLNERKRGWYQKKAKQQGDDMKREFPSCVAGDSLVSTSEGFVPIKDVVPDGKFITAKYPKGIKPVYKITTELGYNVVATEDHPILLRTGVFTPVNALCVGDSICLDGEIVTSKNLAKVNYNPLAFINSEIIISTDIALFLGLFMGDGSFHDGTISIACDNQDQDVVDEAMRLLVVVTGGEPYTRIIGSKQGCCEVRISRLGLVEPFERLGILRRNASRGLKRNVSVPEVIRKSPKKQIAAFLRGLFEADGFAQRNGSGIKFFSKYQDFIQNIQLLLLVFGITSRLSSHDKKSGSGGIYKGWELSLRTEEARIFVDEIGFISERKRSRIIRPKDAPHASKRNIIEMVDRVKSIEYQGETEVFDITTETSQFSANGIIVHNCPKEAFESSIDGSYYSKAMLRVRQEGRICEVPYDQGFPVDVFWDLGMDDSMSLWFRQRIGATNRIIDYYEASGEGLAHYAQILNERRYLYGTHYMPHDASVRELGTGIKRSEKAEELGIKPVVTVVRPRDTEAVLEGIEAVRTFLSTCWFDERKTAAGIKCVDNYRKEWDDRLASFRRSPLHNWASHGADSLRTGAVALKGETALIPSAETKTSWRDRLGGGGSINGGRRPRGVGAA